MSNGEGEQLGKGGRELELHCDVFKFENEPFMGMGTMAHPHPRPSRALPTFPLLCCHVLGLVFVSWACSCACGHVEVAGDVK